MQPDKTISYGMCILQLKRGDVRFLYGDAKFADIIGYELAEITADSFGVKKILAQKAKRRLIKTVYEQLKKQDLVCTEVELISKDFKPIHAVCFFSVYTDEVYGEDCIRTIVMDVTRERAVSQELLEQLDQDSMTKLYNKKTIERMVNQIVDLDISGNHAFFLIDIDNFKSINDTFGHVFGDTVIQDTAKSLEKSFPKKAKIGRVGGDEFVVFLPDTDVDEIHEVAKSVTNGLRREIAAEIELVQISCSIGIALWQEGDTYQDLVKKADAAMYFAKDSGKNQSVLFQDYMLAVFREKKKHVDRTFRGRIPEESYDVEFLFFAYNLLMDSKQFDTSMNLLLERTVERFGLERASVFEVNEGETFLRRMNTGAAKSVRRQGEQECSLEKSWLDERVNEQGDYVVNKVLPGENVPMISNYMIVPKAFVACGLREDDEISGYAFFSQYNNERVWTPYEIKSLHELSKAIAAFRLLRKDKQRNLEQIYYLETRDKVTGLLDKNSFEANLEEYIRHCKSFRCLALVYVDINNFSFINERYGIAAGDDVLRTFAKFMTQDKDNGNLLAGRIFSDCFCGLHRDESKERAIKMLSYAHEKMSEILRKKYPIASLQFKCGIYFLDDPNCSVREAIENANMARKSIKEDGRTTYCVYTSDLRKKREKEQKIIFEFLEVLEKGLLELRLQPNFMVNDGTMRGVEVFGFWNNEQGKERLPVDIVPILKKHGYILEWDFAVYEKVLQLLHRWKEQNVNLPVVEVNFSTADLECSGIVRRIVRLAEKYEIDPQYLVIEMSEHGLRKAPEKVTHVLKELRQNGFKIAIDNFGNSYASLEILLDENIDVIKTGRYLLQETKDEKLRNDYLSYIRRVVKEAEKEIIFVGAENEHQAQKIRECGYNVMQGYLYEKELTVECFEERYIDNNKVSSDSGPTGVSRN